MSFVFAKAQTGSPSGFPAPYSTGYYRIGWIQSDSGSIWAIRDTAVRSKFPGLNFLWLHSGSDTSHWFYDGRAYSRDFNTKDTLPYNQKLATPFWVSSHFQPSGSYQSSLSNTGSGFRIFDPSSSIRSLFCSGCSLDSTSNSGALTITVSGSGGNTNSNVGSGYRFAIPNTNNIKTFFVTGGTLDSTTNSNALTLTIPTYQSSLSNTGSGFRVFTPVSSIKSLVCSGCTIDSTTNAGSLTFTVTGGGSGTVTSVGQTVPTSLLTITGSPVTTNGTLAIGLANAESNSVWGDSTGTAGTPGYYRPTQSLLNTWFGGTIQSQLSNSGTGYRWFVPGSSIRSFVCSGCTLDSTTNAGSLTLTVSGGGGSGGIGVDSVQSVTSGGSITQTTGYNIIQVNPTSEISLTITTATAFHSSNDLYVIFGGSITSGPVCTLTMAAGAGLSFIQSNNPNGTQFYSGEMIRYHKVGSLLYRYN